MPIYEYVCGACGERAEFIEPAGDAPRHRCSGCGKQKMRRAFAAFAARTGAGRRSSSGGGSSCSSCHASSCKGCRH